MKRTKINQKRPGLAHFLKKTTQTFIKSTIGRACLCKVTICSNLSIFKYGPTEGLKLRSSEVMVHTLYHLTVTSHKTSDVLVSRLNSVDLVYSFFSDIDRPNFLAKEGYPISFLSFQQRFAIVLSNIKDWYFFIDWYLAEWFSSWLNNEKKNHND